MDTHSGSDIGEPVILGIVGIILAFNLLFLLTWCLIAKRRRSQFKRRLITAAYANRAAVSRPRPTVSTLPSQEADNKEGQAQTPWSSRSDRSLLKTSQHPESSSPQHSHAPQLSTQSTESHTHYAYPNFDNDPLSMLPYLSATSRDNVAAKQSAGPINAPSFRSDVEAAPTPTKLRSYQYSHTPRYSSESNGSLPLYRYSSSAHSSPEISTSDFPKFPEDVALGPSESSTLRRHDSVDTASCYSSPSFVMDDDTQTLRSHALDTWSMSSPRNSSAIHNPTDLPAPDSGYVWPLRISQRRRSNFTPEDSTTNMYWKTRQASRTSPRLRQYQHLHSVIPFSENSPIPPVPSLPEYIRLPMLTPVPVTRPLRTTSLTTTGSPTKSSVQPPPPSHPLLLDDGGGNPVTPTHQSQRENITPKMQSPAVPPRSPLRAPYM